MRLGLGAAWPSHQGEYSERAASALMQTVLEVVRYCHTLGIIHRDLKLSNFLMSDDTDNAVLKAIDFGSAAFCEFGTPVAAGHHATRAPGHLWGGGDCCVARSALRVATSSRRGILPDGLWLLLLVMDVTRFLLLRGTHACYVRQLVLVCS